MPANGILQSALRIIFKIHYPLPVRNRSPVSPPADIPPSSLPPPSTKPESLGGDQIEKENPLKARAGDAMTGENGKTEIKCKCSTLKLSNQRAGMGVEVPRQPHLSNREM